MSASAGAARTDAPVSGAPVTLPPALRHITAAFDRRTAQGAERILGVALAGRLADASPDEWRGSRLTGDGFPVEVAFSTSDDSLRLTVEPGLASTPAVLRLDQADAALARSGGTRLGEALRDRLASLQAGGALRYGAWLGCRIRPGTTAFKLYAEVPAGHALDENWPDPLRLSDRDVVPRMVAVVPGTGTAETYLRVPSLLPEHLPAVLEPVRLADQSAWLVAFLEEAYGHTLRGRIPGPSVGISYVAGAAPRVSLHLYARAVWGSDARIRRGFLRLAHRMAWDAGPYEKVSAPLADREDWRCYHGLLGITLSPHSAPALTIGLRPVAP